MHKVSYSGKEILFPGSVRCLSPTSMYDRNMFYEFIFLQYIEQLGLSGTYLDVGAAHGNHSMFFENFCQCDNVVAVEPLNDGIFQTIELNGSSVNVIHSGASDREEEVAYGEHTFKTVVLANEDIVNSNKISLVKVDIEGMELKCLRGLEKIIERDSPFIYCEAFTLGDAEKILNYLRPFGYAMSGRIFNITPVYEFLPEKAAQRLPSVNMARRQGMDAIVEVKEAYRSTESPEVEGEPLARPEMAAKLHPDKKTFLQLVVDPDLNGLELWLKVAYFDERLQFRGTGEYKFSNYRKLEIVDASRGAYFVPYVEARGRGKLKVRDFTIFSPGREIAFAG